jgi:hypothetical protein
VEANVPYANLYAQTPNLFSCYISSKIQCTDSLSAANEHVLSAAPFALQQYFSNPRLVIYFFPTSPIK